MKYEYEINGKKYIQKPLVLGQIRQLTPLISGIEIKGGIDAIKLVEVLGDKLPTAVAVLLIPEGTALKDKDVQKLTEEIEFEISPEQTIQVIEDFFLINPISSLSKKLGGLIERMNGNIKQETGLKTSSADSQEGTLPKEITSSGDTHLMSVSPA